AIDPTRFFGQRLLIYLLTGRAVDALRVLEQRGAAVGGQQEPWFLLLRCDVYMNIGRYADAIADCERATAGETFYLVWLSLAAAYGQTDQLEKAVKAKDELLRRVPSFTISRSAAKWALHEIYASAMREHFYPGLRKAGVPE
ncbi:MAG TPA: hypothetical protein VFQ55_02515, partial [Casimicrobiaceae bacterium]|nr:hypothetical protein [Casimicrobiaceae bacterium]